MIMGRVVKSPLALSCSEEKMAAAHLRPLEDLVVLMLR